jgi:hypothetical protein
MSATTLRNSTGAPKVAKLTDAHDAGGTAVPFVPMARGMSNGEVVAAARMTMWRLPSGGRSR